MTPLSRQSIDPHPHDTGPERDGGTSAHFHQPQTHARTWGMQFPIGQAGNNRTTGVKCGQGKAGPGLQAVRPADDAGAARVAWT